MEREAEIDLRDAPYLTLILVVGSSGYHHWGHGEGRIVLVSQKALEKR